MIKQQSTPGLNGGQSSILVAEKCKLKFTKECNVYTEA